MGTNGIFWDTSKYLVDRSTAMCVFSGTVAYMTDVLYASQSAFNTLKQASRDQW